MDREKTYASGTMTAQSQLNMRHPMGMRSVVRMIMAMAAAKEMASEMRKRSKIFGTSCQKFERSTSFLVAPQVMLYEKRWARSACDSGMLSPPKKKKLGRDGRAFPSVQVLIRRRRRHYG